MKCECGETDPTKFYKNQRLRCKKCQSAKNNQRYHSLTEEGKVAYKNKINEWQNDNIFKVRWLSAKARAAKKGIEFTITEQDITVLWEQQKGICYYSGVPMLDTMSKTGHSGSSDTYSVSIERIDSTKGYIPGNVALCCSIVNTMKNNLSLGEFKTIISALYHNLIP
jgi:hypothetical protein